MLLTKVTLMLLQDAGEAFRVPWSIVAPLRGLSEGAGPRNALAPRKTC